MSNKSKPTVDISGFSDEDQAKITALVMDDGYTAQGAVDIINAANEAKEIPPTQISNGWTTIGTVSIPNRLMDRITLDYMSKHTLLDGESKFIDKTYYADGRGKGIQVRQFGGNLIIEQVTKGDQTPEGN